LGCDQKSKHKGFDRSTIEYFDNCVSYDFVIDSLPYDKGPYSGFSLKYIDDTSFLKDDSGIILFEWQGETYYHPGEICRKASGFAATYSGTGNPKYLELLLKYVNCLLSKSIEIDGAVYFPMHFDYRVNQREEGLLSAPWYSGMTQGVALSVLIRTFLITDDSTYLTYANKVFESFSRLHGESEPWIVLIDSRGCYWIEEYPVWPPSMTLNGFIWAVYGLYEYYLITGNERAAEILKASLSSLKNYIPLFRRPGKPSYYGLRFGHYAGGYHMMHIRQLRFLEKISGDPFFGEWADTLLVDYRP
jgi:hypothetical protein